MITGATGFTGRSLVDLYCRRGWQVHGTCRPDSDELPLPDGAGLHTIDLRASDQVDALLREVRPDVVHHLAAQSSVTISWTEPLSTLTDNSGMQLNVLEAVRTWSPGARVVVVGSSDEYGDVAPEDNPVAETQPLRPLSPYALSKVAQDLMGYQYAAVHRLRVMRVRPFLQLGPRRPDTFAVGKFARRIAEIEAGRAEPVVHVGNIDLVRDFSDVRDVAEAMALAADRGEAGEVYNIASGDGHTLRDMIGVMAESAGVRVTLETDGSLVRTSEPPVLVGDASKARMDLGWRPSVSFEESARESLEYWRLVEGRKS